MSRASSDVSPGAQAKATSGASAAASARERELTASVCYCCKTTMAAAGDGAIYAAWRHVYAGNLRDIALTVSRDGGRSFAAPVRVSEDQWAISGCPDDGPAMAVDRTGTVHLIWPTVIDGAEPQGALFYATTRDGRSFTPRVRVPTLGSPKPSHPQIAIDAAGRIVVLWDEVIDGVRVAAMRDLRVGAGLSNAGRNSPGRSGAAQSGAARSGTGQSGGGASAATSAITFGDPVRLGTGSPAMYPLAAATSDGMIAVWTSGATGASVIRVQPLAPARASSGRATSDRSPR